MKWQASSQFLKPRHYEIKNDPSVGFYLYVFEDGKCIRDYLQDTLELAMKYALEDFGVPKDAWKKVDNEKCYPCPCCCFLTRSEPDYGTFEICPVCNWEDDCVQSNDPNFKGGANQESLNEARENYKKFGASAKRYIKEVRAPLPDEMP
jgi:hypothetical protein